jgi:hypothetical protein
MAHYGTLKDVAIGTPAKMFVERIFMALVTTNSEKSLM